MEGRRRKKGNGGRGKGEQERGKGGERAGEGAHARNRRRAQLKSPIYGHELV